MRNAAAIILAPMLAVSATAASFDERLSEANKLLESGDTQAAIEIYRDLQIDQPDSGMLLYNLGVAHYDNSAELMAGESFEDAQSSLEEARESFQQALSVPDAGVRESARFSIANTVLQGAKIAEKANDYEKAVEGYENAIEQYESILQINPDHEPSKLNRAHARYNLKKLLQNPPPEPPQQPEQQGDSDQQQQGDQQEQEGEGSSDQQGEQSQQESQQEEGEQSQDQQGEQQSEQQQAQPSDESESEEQQQSSPQDEGEESEQEPFDLDQMKEAEGEPSDEDQQAQQQAGAPMDEPPPPKNVEALLQSLENQDNMQLHDMKNVKQRMRVNKEWW